MKAVQTKTGATEGRQMLDGARRLVLASLLDSISDAIYFKDRQSRFTLVSRSLANSFHVPSVDHIIGKTDFDFYSEEHARQAFKDEQAMMRTGVPIVNVEEKETWPDGSTTWVSTTKMPLHDETNKIIGTFGISRNITDRKRAQDDLAQYKESLELLVAERTRELQDANTQLQKEIAERKRAERVLLQTERLEAISSMAGGVAVNFNTIIDVISGYASSIACNFIPGSRVHEDATHILEATRRAGELTRRLMGVAQFRDAVPGVVPGAALEPVNLGQVVAEAIELVRNIFQERNVTIETEDVNDGPWVAVDRDQLLDVMMTLLLNGAEAMPAGGAIRIDVSERVVRPRGPDGRPLGRRRAFMVLRVRDSGIGIAREDIDHIFEPFYTTKGSQASFGLGLPFARSAIQAMGGWIMVRSQPGKGSSFRVFIPKARVSRRRPKVRGGAGAQTVLLVDDDAAMLASMERILSSAGYRVISVDNPLKAAEQHAEGFQHIDVCIVDAIMTNGDVPWLVGEIRRRDPQAAMVMTSGFSRDFVRGMLPTGSWSFVQKPFSDGTLVKVVAEASGARDGR